MPLAAVADEQLSFALAPSAWKVEQNRAVILARQNKKVEALVILEKLYRDNTQDVAFVRDYIAVSSWAGKDELAASLYKAV